MAKNNYLLGTLELNGIPPMPKGQPQIEVSFSLDANSNIFVDLEEKSTGIKNSLVVKNDRDRLSKSYIEQKKEEIVNFDELEIEKNKAKINFDIYCYGVKEMLNNQKLEDAISLNEINQIRNKLQEMLDWRNNYPIASKEEYISKKNEFMTMLYPTMKKIYENDDGIL